MSTDEIESKTFLEKVELRNEAVATSMLMEAQAYLQVPYTPTTYVEKGQYARDLNAATTSTTNAMDNELLKRLLAVEAGAKDAQQRIKELEDAGTQEKLDTALNKIKDLEEALAGKANTTYVDMRDNVVLDTRRKRAAAAAANPGGNPTGSSSPSTTPQDQHQGQETNNDNDNDNNNVPGDDDAAADITAPPTSSVGAGTVVAIVAVIVVVVVVLAALVLQCKRNPTGAVATCSANCLARLRGSWTAAGNQSNEEVDPPNAFPMMENPMHETSRADGGGEELRLQLQQGGGATAAAAATAAPAATAAAATAGAGTACHGNG